MARNTFTTLAVTSALTTSAPRWVPPSKPRYASSTRRSPDRPTGQPGRHTPAATICCHSWSLSADTTASVDTGPADALDEGLPAGVGVGVGAGVATDGPA